jgi:D-lactate dehydrogenase
MTSKGVKYVPLDELLQQADIISIHCPLLSSTHHIIDERAIELMKPNVLLVNCGRGPLVNTSALVKGLRSKRLGGVAMDVYEHEAELYFTDRSNEVLPDNEFLQLQSYPNVLITPHTAFLTHEALEGIWATTRKNLDAFAACIARKDEVTKLENQVTV